MTADLPALPALAPLPRKTSSISRARKLLRGVVREDSDDELGDDDIPWEWVYSAEPDSFDQVGRAEINGKKREIVAARMGSAFGAFGVAIGDCVFIKGEGLQGEAYVGMICEFKQEGEEGGDGDGDGDRAGGRAGKSKSGGNGGGDGGGGEMVANVMWFSTEFEVKNKEKKRMDFLPVGPAIIATPSPLVRTD